MRRGASVPAVTIGIIAAAGWAVVGGVVVVGTVGGCRSASPPPRVAVPSHADGSPEITYRHDPVKPMPAPGGRAADDELAGAQFDDPPLVTQRPPEQRAFVEAYNRVGRPRMAVLVNPVLAGGSQDELQARAIDYAAMETILADWIGANGQVTLISPTAARQRLSPEQVRDLQTSGSTTSPAAQQVAQDLNADVFIQVRVEPTRQANQPAARIVSEAVNARGGQSVARAVVDVPPPLEKTQINRYTRFVARKLMDDMTGAWSTMPGPAASSGASGELQAMPPQQQSMPVQRQSAAPPSSPPSDSGFAAPAPQQPPLAQPPAPGIPAMPPPAAPPAAATPAPLPPPPAPPPAPPVAPPAPPVAPPAPVAPPPPSVPPTTVPTAQVETGPMPTVASDRIRATPPAPAPLEVTAPTATPPATIDVAPPTPPTVQATPPTPPMAPAPPTVQVAPPTAPTPPAVEVAPPTPSTPSAVEVPPPTPSTPSAVEVAPTMPPTPSAVEVAPPMPPAADIAAPAAARSAAEAPAPVVPPPPAPAGPQPATPTGR